MTTQIDELTRDTFIHFDEHVSKWLVVHNKDVPDQDSETGELIWGMVSNVINEVDTEEEAVNALANYREYQKQFS